MEHKPLVIKIKEVRKIGGDTSQEKKYDKLVEYIKCIETLEF